VQLSKIKRIECRRNLLFVIPVAKLIIVDANHFGFAKTFEL
jgi:hypothetical protein